MNPFSLCSCISQIWAVIWKSWTRNFREILWLLWHGIRASRQLTVHSFKSNLTTSWTWSLCCLASASKALQNRAGWAFGRKPTSMSFRANGTSHCPARPGKDYLDLRSSSRTLESEDGSLSEICQIQFKLERSSKIEPEMEPNAKEKEQTALSQSGIQTEDRVPPSQP